MSLPMRLDVSDVENNFDDSLKSFPEAHTTISKALQQLLLDGLKTM